MHTAYLSLGSNSGDRMAHIAAAIAALDTADARVMRVSAVYETAYVGPRTDDLPPFLNCCVELQTPLAPDALLGLTQAVETAGARVRGRLHDPRTIDIDILLIDGIALDTPSLTIPHPRMAERAFVLTPLAEIAADAVLPGGVSVGDLANHPGIAAQPVHRYATSIHDRA